MREKGMTLHQVASITRWLSQSNGEHARRRAGDNRFTRARNSLCPGARRLAYSCLPFYLAFVWAPPGDALLFLTADVLIISI